MSQAEVIGDKEKDLNGPLVGATTLEDDRAKKTQKMFEDRAERRERVLDVLSGVLTVAGAIAFLALCWLLIREREAADAERRARDPQGAEARVERRLMAEDAAYRLCRRAAASALCLPKDAAR